ncbi:hypothetical protein RIF29_13959 [Crotalaria pallida]|uniref:TraB domain-containing protein-like n=1 Tax=Crotalaria pallida TaxID=3830 RepID=A0AAN9IB55_CROPI
MNRLLQTRAQLTCRVQTQSLKQCSSTSTATTPSKLPDHVLPLTCPSSAKSGFCEVYLIGTVHISQKSCAEVRALINFLRPEVVFLELCKSRQALLKDQKIPTAEEIVTAAWKKRSNVNILGLLLSLIYASIANEHKVIPGSEFRVAYEEAIKYGGRAVLGDRSVQVTLARAWRKMPLQEKMRLFTCLFRKKSSRLSEVMSKLLEGRDVDIDMDMVSLIVQEFGKMCPTLLETIVHERDVYMSYALLQEAKKSSCIVAVVGMGHLRGIKKHWEQPILATQVKDLLKIPPPPKPAMSTIILASVGVFVAGVSMVWGYLH